jgi:polar amino acid transport system substrate-binding protein
MAHWLLAVSAAIACLLTAGCQFPRDPEGTLERSTGGTLRVGVAENPPWVRLGGREPGGVEPELIRRFAATIDAEVAWHRGSETELIEALRGFQLDVVIAGLTTTSVWQKEVAITSPYLDTEIQFAVPPGEELPDDLDGV